MALDPTFPYWEMANEHGPDGFDGTIRNPPFTIEQGTRQFNYSMEGNEVQCPYHINKYGYYIPFVHFMCGGVSPAYPRQRLWPKQDSYHKHCYAFDARDMLVGHTKGVALAGSPAIQAGPSLNMFKKEVPSGGAYITIKYREIKAPLIEKPKIPDPEHPKDKIEHFIGQYDLDWVDKVIDPKVNSISVSNLGLGWRKEDVKPKITEFNIKGAHASIAESITGLSIKRLYVPEYTEQQIRRLMPQVQGKINIMPACLPGRKSQCGQTWAEFPTETLRFDDMQSVLHQDIMGNVFYTLILDFSINNNLGSEHSGFWMKRIGWNSMYNSADHGWMRVSAAHTWTSWWNPDWKDLGDYVIPDDLSLYERTPLFPQLFRIFDGEIPDCWTPPKKEE